MFPVKTIPVLPHLRAMILPNGFIRVEDKRSGLTCLIEKRSGIPYIRSGDLHLGTYARGLIVLACERAPIQCGLGITV